MIHEDIDRRLVDFNGDEKRHVTGDSAGRNRVQTLIKTSSAQNFISFSGVAGAGGLEVRTSSGLMRQMLSNFRCGVI